MTAPALKVKAELSRVAVADRTAQAAVIAGAETLGGDDRQSVGETDADQHQHEKQRCGNADGRQRLDADQTADDNDVGYAVELLKDVADQQRN